MKNKVKYFKNNMSVLPVDILWDVITTEEEHDRNLNNYIEALLARFIVADD